MTTRYSNSYIGTLDANSEEDMKRLAALRKQVSRFNKGTEKKNRVVVRGRRPIEKKERTNFWTGKTSTVAYDHGGNIVGGLANATSYDVYIYAR